MVQAWSPDFDPLRDDIATTPVWVRLSNIPVNFYHKTILMGIARGLGKPIKVDLTTLNVERARFARICVELNLKKPLKGTVMINGERYFVSYEGLTNICPQCGLYGHMVHTCPRGVHERAVTPLAPRGTENMSVVNQLEDGFIAVRQTGRRSDLATRRAGPTVGSGKGNMERNHQQSAKNKDTENVVISNIFGRLEEDMETLELREEDTILLEKREEVSLAGDNKENKNTTN
ncbi:hypothetical protein V5N11_004128 [Cardamine amara subsp. amara]|uniref:MH2 domain-containing protein n=1 Tax=Cardamine amara subsp. amara TaxID=228776 RepID=A0ABD1BWF1_CARAN